MRARLGLLLSAGIALALPAAAQQPATETNAAQPPASSPGPAAQRPTPRPGYLTPTTPGDVSLIELSDLNLPPPPPPVEYPAHARRDPWVVGVLDPALHGLGANPFGSSSGAFLSTLMRRMSTPLASRWAHIAMRNALIAEVRAPRDVNPVDWAAERAWLLLRMGEADAAQMLVADVDTDRFTPKMVQVAVQTALATADPPALCPIEAGIRRHEPGIRALVQAMCSSLAGEPESAAAQIDDARRRGRIGGIDLTLAEKVVGAGSNTGRAVTIEWEPVDTLTSWRFGLATATGMTPPDRLLKDATPRLRAFQARAPLLSAQQRLGSAMIATGLGVFSSQSMVDLYSSIYDSTDPGDLPETDAWQLRQAFVGRDAADRVGAIRRLLGSNRPTLEREAMRASVARAAALIPPSADLEEDAPELISAMLAAGYDRHAARWAPAVARMDDDKGDRAWAMLALASPTTNNIDLSFGRVTSFINRDQSPGKIRSALLVAGLAGLGKINERSANSLNQRYGFRLGMRSSWTNMIDSAGRLRQPGSVLMLTGSGLQTSDWERVPAAHLYHALIALRRTGQEFSGRMIAAEALSRT